jgi:hypothetical protein
MAVVALEQTLGSDRYYADLLIDQVSFTAHSLRAHRREPLE